MELTCRLLRAVCVSAMLGAAAFTAVLFTWLLCFSGDAGLDVTNVLTIEMFSASMGLIALLVFLVGMATIGLSGYAILTRFNLTGRIWAAFCGGGLAGIVAWPLFADLAASGIALTSAAILGGVVGALMFREIVLDTTGVKPPPAPPS